MTSKKTPPISENPSAKELSDMLPLVKAAKGITGFLQKIGLDTEAVGGVNDAAEAALTQSDILDLPDRFNSAFGRLGWVATNSMSVDVMREAIAQFEAGDVQGAEQTVMDWFSADNIRLFGINRSKSFNKATNRWHQLNEAWQLTEEERYYSAVPLILIICDGFASDVLGSSPFEKDADLTLFDSIVGHETALPSLIGQTTKGVRKSSDDEVDYPLRHGILHGRTLGYANRKVCLKAWMLFISLVDWAIDKREEEARRAKHEGKEADTWSAFFERQRKHQADKAAMETFQPTEWLNPSVDDFEKDSPVFSFFEFLQAWQSKNYGRMASRAVNLTGMKHGYLAGRLRNDGELIELLEFDIQSVKQTSVARADAIVVMKGSSLKGPVQGTYGIAAFRNTETGDVAMPTDIGDWQVQQGCMFNLLHQREIN
ncbi:hypothetical protein [Sulfitobacter pacificus]|uniref:Zorya protein ZorC EH domain-containing protein n=1 Tax=Sulfitobacter pacificus TaxID=1499314 RepID=A0ABQ5VJX7_9RHOB|nr:hypothetical protein [Sulfitobacter pacificus]GLQ27430.1 hypothetical protein GCM10007927_22330 [Sulfitobacter pacificus]